MSLSEQAESNGLSSTVNFACVEQLKKDASVYWIF